MNESHARRLTLLVCAATLAWEASFAQHAPDAPVASKPRIAAVCTAYQPFLHADVIVSKFILGFPTDEGLLPPQVRIASLYIDRGPTNSLGCQLAERFDIPLYDTVEGALTLGGKRLAVDGVLLIGEHGNYPKNPHGQVLYPRMLMMQRILRVFEWSGRSVPVFCDKQLAHNWTDAKWMYDRARELNVPLMAGSVIPLNWRDPPTFEQPLGARVSEAVVVYHGELDRYAIHGLEMLQSLLERRRGGETGVKRIECVQGEAFDRACATGRVPMELVDAALRNHAGFDTAQRPLVNTHHGRIAILLDYLDGTRAAVLLLGPHYTLRWFYASRTAGKILTCEFGRPREDAPTGMTQPVAIFSYQGLNIQKMFLTGKPQYPVERTLLTTGLSAIAVRSLADGRPIDTPFLAIRYKPEPFEPIRPSGRHATGASLAPWPEDETLRPLFVWRNDL